jgi:hypothetical protein
METATACSKDHLNKVCNSNNRKDFSNSRKDRKVALLPLLLNNPELKVVLAAWLAMQKQRFGQFISLSESVSFITYGMCAFRVTGRFWASFNTYWIMRLHPVDHLLTHSFRMGELEPWIDENFIRSVWFGMGENVNVKMIRDKFSGWVF